MRRVALALALALVLVAACGSPETVAPRPETVIGTVATPELPTGDPENGLSVFVDAGCGSCHTLNEAQTESAVGPDLDESLGDEDAEYIRTSIVNPDAEITEGFQPGIMPQNYGQQLSDQELADLVTFLAETTGAETG